MYRYSSTDRNRYSKTLDRKRMNRVPIVGRRRGRDGIDPHPTDSRSIFITLEILYGSAPVYTCFTWETFDANAHCLLLARALLCYTQAKLRCE